MRTGSPILAAAMYGAAVLTLAACASQPEAAGAGAQLAAGDKQICKRLTPMGSNMPQRVCASEAEWDAREKAGRREYDNLRREAGAEGSSSFPR